MKLAKAISSILAVSTFVYYQHVFVTTGVKPNELFLVGSGLSIAAFAFLSINWKDHISIISLQLLCSSFFLAVTFIYIRRWIVEGNGSTNYYTALSFCVIFTFIYLVYPFVWKYVKQLYYYASRRKQSPDERK
jgi:hypothetical protein